MLATALGFPTGLKATAEADSATIVFTAPTDTGLKTDGETPVPVNEISLVLHYASGLKNSPDTNCNEAEMEVLESGNYWSSSEKNQSMVSGENKITLTGLTSNTVYYYMLRLIHPETASLGSSSELMSFTTKGDSDSTPEHPSAPKAPETRVGSNSFFLNIAAPGPGTKRDGTPVAESEVKMMLYYAKAEASGETMTAEALKESATFLSSSNEEDIIKFGAPPPTTIPGLPPGTKYYYLIVLIHPEDDSLTAESPVGSFTTIKATSPGVVTGLSVATTDTTATITFTAPENTGLKADGETAVPVGELFFAVRYFESSVNLKENPDKEMHWVNKEQPMVADEGKNTVTLRDLSPNTEYSYQVIVASPDADDHYSQTELKTFTTREATQ